jgi:hypothetical protein
MIKDSKHQLGVYSVVSDETGCDLWVEIGYATPRLDGEGFDLTLRALPLGSRVVLREAASDDSRAELREDSQQDWPEEPHDTRVPSLAGKVREFERAVIRQCLLETDGNIAAALERLKIPRRTLNEDGQLGSSPSQVVASTKNCGQSDDRIKVRRTRPCTASRACSWNSRGGARTEPPMASSLRARPLH